MEKYEQANEEASKNRKTIHTRTNKAHTPKQTNKNINLKKHTQTNKQTNKGRQHNKSKQTHKGTHHTKKKH